MQVDPESDYITPGTLDLEQLFWTGTGAQYDHVNQVWPGIYIGDEWVNAHRGGFIVLQYSCWQLHIESVCENRKTALERSGLRDLGITHVLNAAEGKWNNVLTGADYYRDMDIQYYGVEADDKPTFNMSQYFSPAAQFIHEALSYPQSKSWRKSKAWSGIILCRICCFLFVIHLFASFCSRQGAGALRDGAEQVCDSGLGVLDVET